MHFFVLSFVLACVCVYVNIVASTFCEGGRVEAQNFEPFNEITKLTNNYAYYNRTCNFLACSSLTDTGWSGCHVANLF